MSAIFVELVTETQIGGVGESTVLIHTQSFRVYTLRTPDDFDHHRLHR